MYIYQNPGTFRVQISAGDKIMILGTVPGKRVCLEPYSKGYNHAPPMSMTPVEQFQPFEQGCIIGLRETGWIYRWIAAHVGHNVSVVCCCFQQWPVAHSHTHRSGSGQTVQTYIKINILCEQQWLPEQHPGKKSGHMLHLLCHQ